MIPHNLLDLAKCMHCNKAFKDKDLVVSIVSSNYEDYCKDYIADTVNIGEDDGPIEVFKRINFHRACFMLVAGEEWTP